MYSTRTEKQRDSLQVCNTAAAVLFSRDVVVLGYLTGGNEFAITLGSVLSACELKNSGIDIRLRVTHDTNPRLGINLWGERVAVRLLHDLLEVEVARGSNGTSLDRGEQGETR